MENTNLLKMVTVKGKGKMTTNEELPPAANYRLEAVPEQTTETSSSSFPAEHQKILLQHPALWLKAKMAATPLDAHIKRPAASRVTPLPLGIYNISLTHSLLIFSILLN